MTVPRRARPRSCDWEVARTFSESDRFLRGKGRDGNGNGNTNNTVKMLYEMIGVVCTPQRWD